MILLDGKQTSAAIKVEITSAVNDIKNQGNRAPHLAALESF
jgi:methylenetetrahydrofolate dehydrogenase (NADP+)/methenyltetrahydrofolate cyclohydrolase